MARKRGGLPLVPRAYVFGISGIGKEYVRLLVDDLRLKGLDLILVDFPRVLATEVQEGKLRNSFPHHEFEVSLPKGTRFLEPGASVGVDLRTCEVGYAFICTPHTEAGRAFVPPLLARSGLRILVEKPNRPPVFGVSVGYLYSLAPPPISSIRLFVPRPAEGSWRWKDPNPLLWDAVGHAFSVLTPRQLSEVEVGTLSPERFTGRSGRVEIEVAYQEHPHSDMEIDGVRHDWNVYFRQQVKQFLIGKEVGRNWPAVEDALRGLEQNAGIPSRTA